MKHQARFVLSLVVICYLASTAAQSKRCGGKRGVCKEAGDGRCTRIAAGSCQPGFKCCVQGERNVVGEPRANRRKCKPRRKCSRYEGSCIKSKSICNGLGVDSLCKGASCKCCLTGAGESTCKSRPTCRFRGGLCVNKKKANVLCAAGTIDASGCRRKKCNCCHPNEKSCLCGIAKVRVPQNTTMSAASNSTTQSTTPEEEGEAKEEEEEEEEESPLPHQFPWLAGIQISPDDSNYSCTGAIINNNFVVTAANCVYNLDPSDVKVGIADFDQSSTDDDIPGVTRSMGIDEIIVHKKFSITSLQNNIALLRLNESLDLVSNSEVKPVCLPTEDEDFEGEEAFTASWGVTNAGNDTSLYATPTHTNLTILDEDCDGSIVISGVAVTGTNLCADRAIEGSCTGDAGTPLTVLRDGRHVLVGLLSAVDCSEVPELHTRVTKYIKWIGKSTDREDSFCA